MHLQVRNLGREWAFEVGIVDLAGRVGIVRPAVYFSGETFLFPLYPNHPTSDRRASQKRVRSDELNSCIRRKTPQNQSLVFLTCI
jgi:hypothetical protein